MKKLFLDTNVWLRFFLKDNEKQYGEVEKLISSIEEGKFKVYTSAIVILEVNYVLKNVYEIEFEEILEIIEAIRRFRGITIVEKTNLDIALKFYRKYKIKLSDCLIVSQIPKDALLVTFDEEMEKIREATVVKPSHFNAPSEFSE